MVLGWLCSLQEGGGGGGSLESPVNADRREFQKLNFTASAVFLARSGRGGGLPWKHSVINRSCRVS